MTGRTILIVDDEAPIREMIAVALEMAGYECLEAGNSQEALAIIVDRKPDLLLLDWMLPGSTGIELARRLKRDELTADIPIIMLTAKGEEEDIVAGFNAGADDYVTKPFRPKILLARVQAVLRRGAAARPDEDEPLRIGALVIHPGRHEVADTSGPVDLTRTEFRILQFLASRPGWVFTRSQIVRAVHGDDYPVTGRSVDVQVAALRRKLGESGAMIHTVRGVGYKMGD